MDDLTRREAIQKVAACVAVTATCVVAVGSAGAEPAGAQCLGNGSCTRCGCRGFKPKGGFQTCYCGHAYESHKKIHTTSTSGV